MEISEINNPSLEESMYKLLGAFTSSTEGGIYTPIDILHNFELYLLVLHL